MNKESENKLDHTHPDNLAELRSFALMMGASQYYSDGGLIAMVCPQFAGKSLQDLTPEELQELMTAAEQMEFGEEE